MSEGKYIALILAALLGFTAYWIHRDEVRIDNEQLVIQVKARAWVNKLKSKCVIKTEYHNIPYKHGKFSGTFTATEWQCQNFSIVVNEEIGKCAEDYEACSIHPGFLPEKEL